MLFHVSVYDDAASLVLMTTPVIIPSFMSSFLLMQQEKSPAGFSARYPGPWLLWEPGAWNVASSLKATMVLAAPPAQAQSAEALCFMLAHRVQFKVGRDPSNDVVINDGTVSRHHLELTMADGRWFAKPVGGRTVLRDGQRLPEEGSELPSGSQLQLGNVTLSFYDSAHLLARLKEAHSSIRRQP